MCVRFFLASMRREAQPRVAWDTFTCARFFSALHREAQPRVFMHSHLVRACVFLCALPCALLFCHVSMFREARPRVLVL